jgi:putative transport protein
MIEFLAENTVLLVFVTAALGYLVGRITIKGASLGVAAVLFVGLAIGSQDPSLAVPEFARTAGLAIFVYTIGLSSGAGFFASLNRQGLRNNLLVIAMLTLGAGLALATAMTFDLGSGLAAGFFSGTFTNTPAMAAVIEAVRAGGGDEAAQNSPTIGYSIAYPMGVLGPILAIAVARRIYRINYRKEAAQLVALHLVQEEIDTQTVRVTRPQTAGLSVREVQTLLHQPVVFTRVVRGDDTMLADGSVVLEEGDLVTVVGEPPSVAAAIERLGEADVHHPELDRSRYDFRRIFVSNSAVVGRPLRDLRLPEHYGAIVSRVRRGDIDVTMTASSVLELGDRVRVVAERSRMKDVTRLLGDSYRHLSEIDLLSFGLGLSLGLLLGAIPIPIGPGLTFKLGSAAGPLIVGLVLGAVRRTGPIVWNIPYSANLTLRQIGLILFLTAVGLSSGYTFRTTFAGSTGLTLLGIGAIVSFGVPLLTLVLGYRFLKVPFGQLTGMLSAQQTQPAVLGYALEDSKDEAPNVGWSLVYPVAMITKILLGQVIFIALGGVLAG